MCRLVFDMFDTWIDRSIGGCTWHVAHPGGRHYETFPVNANEAESRRAAARFFAFGHTAGRTRDPAAGAESRLSVDARSAASGQHRGVDWMKPQKGVRSCNPAAARLWNEVHCVHDDPAYGIGIPFSEAQTGATLPNAPGIVMLDHDLLVLVSADHGSNATGKWMSSSTGTIRRRRADCFALHAAGGRVRRDGRRRRAAPRTLARVRRGGSTDWAARGFGQRWEQARRLFRENGVTYNVYGDPQGPDRPWELDPIPLLIGQERVAIAGRGRWRSGRGC